MSDDKFDDLNEIEDDEDEDEDEEEPLTFDKMMAEAHGSRMDWESDAKFEKAFFSPAYNRFLKNGCRGILTYEEAVEEYRIYTGCVPDTATSWPHLDWLKKRRKEASENEELIRVVSICPSKIIRRFISHTNR